MGIDYSKVDPKTRELIEKVQKNRPDVLSLEELKKVTEKLDALLTYLQKQNKTVEKTNLDLADVLFDVRESLDDFSSQEAPEIPNYAEPVVSAVEDLKTALTASINAIDVSPKIATPSVKVDAPKVDLSGVERAVKEVSKVVEAAIKKIPKTEIPKTDFAPLTKKFEDMLAKLEDIDNGVRMKPQAPNVMKVTNVDSTPINTPISYTKRYDIQGSIIYSGRATPGTDESDPGWTIVKFDFTTGSASSGKIAENVAWSTHASETYV